MHTTYSYQKMLIKTARQFDPTNTNDCRRVRDIIIPTIKSYISVNTQVLMEIDAATLFQPRCDNLRDYFVMDLIRLERALRLAQKRLAAAALTTDKEEV